MPSPQPSSRSLFHLCSPDLRDETLYPLNELRTRHPDLYHRELVKWAGRESVLDLRIPYLGCVWGVSIRKSCGRVAGAYYSSRRS
jgi:hypothetical protein